MPFLSVSRAGGLALALIASLPPSVAGQAPSDTLRLVDAVAAALRANPSLVAGRLAADAAAERVPQAGALPDPELSLGLMNRPWSGFGTDEPMTMNQVQLSQRLPWPGKRGLARDRADALASAAKLDVAEAEVALASGVAERYYALAAIDRSMAILSRTRELLRSFFEVSQARYATGESPQQDVLHAQVAVAQVTEELTTLQQSRIAAAARLNALLGRPATTPVAALALPPIGGEIAAVDSLMAVAGRRRPALRAADERVRGAEAGVRSAQRERFPDFTVAVAYGQRPQYDDMATLMVGVTLPIWSGSKLAPMRREMVATEAMERARVDDVANETFAALTEARADAEQARALGALYATAILPQARAGVEAALSAYRVGQVDYSTLVESEMTVNRYEIEVVRLTARYHQAVARIDALLGAGGMDR